MNMIIDKMRKEMNKANQSRENLMKEIETLKQKASQAEVEASAVASDGDFKKAEKILLDIEKINNEIEMKRKFYTSLDIKKSKKIEKVGREMLEEFKNSRNNRLKKGETLSNNLAKHYDGMLQIIKEMEELEREDQEEENKVLEISTKAGMQYKDNLPFDLSQVLQGRSFQVLPQVLFSRRFIEKEFEKLNILCNQHNTKISYPVIKEKKL